MKEFNLPATVREVLDSTDLNNPGDVAKEVASRIPSRERPGALLEALRHYVRVMMHPGSPAGHAGGDAQGNTAGGDSSRSAKRDAITSWYQRVLRDRYHAGDNDWRQLGDFDHAACDFAAQERYEIARRTEAAGHRFAALRDRLQQAGVTYVRDLPAEDLTAAGFGREAA